MLPYGALIGETALGAKQGDIKHKQQTNHDKPIACKQNRKYKPTCKLIIARRNKTKKHMQTKRIQNEKKTKKNEAASAATIAIYAASVAMLKLA